MLLQIIKKEQKKKLENVDAEEIISKLVRWQIIGIFFYVKTVFV